MAHHTIQRDAEAAAAERLLQGAPDVVAKVAKVCTEFW